MIEAIAHFVLILFIILSALWLIDSKARESKRKQIEKDAFSWHKKTKGRAYEKYNYRKIIQESSER
jgi:hypothetical protein